MAKKKQYSEMSEYKIPPTTYAVQTAETLLRGYGVTFSKKDMTTQLMDNSSFYKKLLQVPAITIYNDYLLRQCREMQFYCAEQVVNMLFANSGLQAANPEGKAPLSEQKQQAVMNIQDINNEFDHDLNDVAEQQQHIMEQTKAISKQAIMDWDKHIAASTDKIVVKLTELGFQLSTEFPNKLKQRLKKRGAGMDIPAEQLTEYHVKAKLSGIEKAIIGTLIEEMRHA